MKYATIVLVFALALLGFSYQAAAQSPTYTGASTCQGCHAGGSGGTQYTAWSQTLHAQAYDSIAFVHNKSECASCHTTGWDTTKANQGADDYVTLNADSTFTINDASGFAGKTNVQCEACHGPVQLGVNHGFPAPTPGSLQKPQAEVCGSCHTGSHNPYYDEWKTTAHSLSDTNASAFLKTMFRSDSSCSGCHTYQGFVQFVQDTALAPHVNPPGDAALPLVCVACHDPHSKANAKQLRLPKEQLCEKCHQPEYDPANPVPGTAVHNTMSYMFEGKGGYEYNGYTYTSSLHTAAVTEKCVTCHMHSSPFVSEAQIAKTGHTFEPKSAACIQCHADYDTAAASFDYRRVQTVTDSLATVLSTKLAAASSADSTTDAFKRAQFNYSFVSEDKSHGIHNTHYAQTLLQSSIDNFVPTLGVKSVGNSLPSKFELQQNYPNPFNPSTVITFALPSQQFVRLRVYDILGNLVATLVNENVNIGTYNVTWNGTNVSGKQVPTGIYLYKIEAGSFTVTKKMMLLK